MQTMKANVFRGPNTIGIEEVPRPEDEPLIVKFHKTNFRRRTFG